MVDVDTSSGIYIIYNIIDNKIYIGSAINLRERWFCHKSFLNNGDYYG